MKLVWLVLKRALLFVAAFLVLYVLFSIVLSYIPVGKKNSKSAKHRSMYIHSNGVHVDFILPVDGVDQSLRQQLTVSPAARYLAFGWGDKGFYLDTPTWAELKFSTAFKAMFLPSSTAMHVTEHMQVEASWAEVALTQVQWTELMTFIHAGFELDSEGRPQEIIDTGYTPFDRFYEGVGSYSCFKTCNTWVNAGLRQIGVQTAIWTPWDKGIMRYLDKVEVPGNESVTPAVG